MAQCAVCLESDVYPRSAGPAGSISIAPFARSLGLLRPIPARQTGIKEVVEEEVETWGSDRGEEVLAVHPGARPGLLPNGEKTSPHTSRSSRLCGDRDLSLHLKGKQHPIVICLNNLVHRTSLKTL